MANTEESMGFRLTEVEGRSPLGLDAADDPLTAQITARVSAAASNMETSRKARKSRGSVKPIRNTRWRDPEVFDLQPSGQRNFTVGVREPALLLLRANWTGSVGTLQVTAKVNGAAPRVGRITKVPPDRGTVLLSTEVENPGSVEVSIASSNRTTRVTVEVFVGTIPLAKRMPKDSG